MRKIVIGVMGPGDRASETELKLAYEIGQLIAQNGWVLLTGGRDTGVMDAASKGAKAANGLTIGVLPSNNSVGISEAVDIAIITDMGNARNNINVLSSHVVIACGMGAGTASEIALALKANKQVILLNVDRESQIFFQKLSANNVFVAQNPREAIDLVRKVLSYAF
jgi:uncharacterized protein (TIGR00725 family)